MNESLIEHITRMRGYALEERIRFSRNRLVETEKGISILSNPMTPAIQERNALCYVSRMAKDFVEGIEMGWNFSPDIFELGATMLGRDLERKAGVIPQKQTVFEPKLQP